MGELQQFQGERSWQVMGPSQCHCNTRPFGFILNYFLSVYPVNRRRRERRSAKFVSRQEVVFKDKTCQTSCHRLSAVKWTIWSPFKQLIKPAAHFLIWHPPSRKSPNLIYIFIQRIFLSNLEKAEDCMFLYDNLVIHSWIWRGRHF